MSIRAAATMPKSTTKKARGTKPGASRASRGDHAYDTLFGAIESGSLKPGTRLREVELSEWVGASRTPIREALGRLEGEGLIARDPSRGMIVAELDHGLVAELYVMREVLEGTAAGLAARHASDAEIDALRTLARARPGDRGTTRCASRETTACSTRRCSAARTTASSCAR